MPPIHLQEPGIPRTSLTTRTWAAARALTGAMYTASRAPRARIPTPGSLEVLCAAGTQAAPRLEAPVTTTAQTNTRTSSSPRRSALSREPNAGASLLSCSLISARPKASTSTLHSGILAPSRSRLSAACPPSDRAPRTVLRLSQWTTTRMTWAQSPSRDSSSPRPPIPQPTPHRT